MRILVRPAFNPSLPVGLQRRWANLVSKAIPPPPEPRIEPAGLLGAGPIESFRIGIGPEDPGSRRALLWAHGGGFVLGGRKTHGALAGHLAAATGADVYLPEYRLAPEHPVPAAVDDLYAAWQDLIARGYDPARMALGGDSAGGGLAVLTALTLREMGVPGPRALVLISPVTDLALGGHSIQRNRRSDAMLTPEWLATGCAGFAGKLRRTDPKVSPAYAELSGLPPTLIQVTEGELLLDDSLRFADRAWGAGVEVELQRFGGLWHDFQMHVRLLDAAADAVDDIGGFLNRRWEA